MDTVTVYDDRGDWNVGLMYGLNITGGYGGCLRGD